MAVHGQRLRSSVHNHASAERGGEWSGGGAGQAGWARGGDGGGERSVAPARPRRPPPPPTTPHPARSRLPSLLEVASGPQTATTCRTQLLQLSNNIHGLYIDHFFLNSIN
ncbi:hypothetical protein R5R35_005090 [Gryllus longicercus]|uniref:Uncharacterized protein n=1 Tax=Gryllus longicercus TaxID=2509291 RepID=A0AAN9V6M8_9ORTH